MAFFYFMNQIVAAETIKGGILFKGGNYSQKYGMQYFLLINHALSLDKSSGQVTFLSHIPYFLI